MPVARNTAGDHISELLNVLPSLNVGMLSRWGSCLSEILPAGHRLLVAGNGGSAAQAGHLAAELVGRFQSDRLPLSAISLASDPAVLSALGNDFGIAEIFSRQVQAHGRRGDILLLLSTSGRSQNLLRAVSWARQLGLLTWAITGAAPNELEQLVDEAFCVESSSA
jgi:phosphoheptose isomerase